MPSYGCFPEPSCPHQALLTQLLGCSRYCVPLAGISLSSTHPFSDASPHSRSLLEPHVPWGGLQGAPYPAALCPVRTGTQLLPNIPHLLSATRCLLFVKHNLGASLCLPPEWNSFQRRRDSTSTLDLHGRWVSQSTAGALSKEISAQVLFPSHSRSGGEAPGVLKVDPGPRPW